jgi:hypothetical protein
MVSKSLAWRAIAAELGLSGRTPGIGRGERIGHDIAVEKASAARAARDQPEVHQTTSETQHTLRMIKKLAKKDAEPLLAKYELGEMTDEQVRNTVKVLLGEDD